MIAYTYITAVDAGQGEITLATPPGNAASVSKLYVLPVSAAIFLQGADGDTLETLSDQIDGIGAGGLTAQETADAVYNLAPASSPAAGSLGAQVEAIRLDTGTTLPALVGGLDGATVTVVSAVSGGTITVRCADTWRFTVLSDQLALGDYESLGLVVKRAAGQVDNAALLALRTTTGLVRIGGSAPVLAANGSLTSTANSFTAVVALAETSGLQPGQYSWWLKGYDTTPDPDEALTLATGEFVVLAAGLNS